MCVYVCVGWWVRTCGAQNSRSTSWGSSLRGDDPSEKGHMHALMHSHSRQTPRVPDVWPQIPPPSGWEKPQNNTATVSHTVTVCVSLPARGSLYLANAFQPMPSVTVSHVASGRKYNKPTRCDIILVHICFVVCFCANTCTPPEHYHCARVMIARVDERQWEEKKRRRAGRVHYHCAWLTIFHLGRRHSTSKINQWGVLIWDGEESYLGCSRG